MQNDWKLAAKILKNDGVVVIPTDTLYGIVGSAFSPIAIDKIYNLKDRNREKKLIYLVSSIRDLKKFGIKVSKLEKKILKKYWPGEVSIIIDDIAFRLPNKNNLISLIKKVGPLAAPSANKESQKPAENVEEAKNYFGDKVSLYIDEGEKISEPSTLIKIKDNGIEVIREGKVKII